MSNLRHSRYSRLQLAGLSEFTRAVVSRRDNSLLAGGSTQDVRSNVVRGNTDDNSFPLHMTPEVRAALQQGKPVVALESTIISHGMPYPQNVECARSVEAVVRDQGAVPATIAILDGKVCVGLSNEQLERLGSLGPSKVSKTSRRDIARIVAEGGNGATTVSGTLVVASMAGISVFVTGGIGGVHRGVESTMDVSADLTELGRSGGIAVVCAGAKSILDIPRTLEYLETQGVTVVGYGVDEFPAFFTRSSHCPVPTRLDSPRQCAELIDANTRLKLGTGIVIGVPVPEQHEAQAAVVEGATQQALRETQEKGIAGRDITPYILKRVNELTSGASLKTNIALVHNNALVGSQIAVALAQHRQGAGRRPPSSSSSSSSSSSIAVFGGAVVDLNGTPSPSIPYQAETSNPGQVSMSFGGVGRNIAECLARLGCHIRLHSTIGQDSFGQALHRDLSEYSNIDTAGVRVIPQHRTAVYSAMFDSRGDLVGAIADMDILEQAPLSSAQLAKAVDPHAVQAVVIDANLSPAYTLNIACKAHERKIPVFFEPTSVAKATRMAVVPDFLARVTCCKPNADELIAMARAVHEVKGKDIPIPTVTMVNHCSDEVVTPTLLQATAVLIGQGVGVVVVSLGARGVLTVARSSSAGDNGNFTCIGRFHAPHALSSTGLVNASGAGDCLFSGIIAYCTSPSHKRKSPTSDLMERIIAGVASGQACAVLTLGSARSVSTAITPAVLQAENG